jgi:hypothetical protein
MADTTIANDRFDTELAELLTELSDAQQELLSLLGEKRVALMSANTAYLARLQPREVGLIDRLQACQARRWTLLEQAKQDGLPSGSLADLAQAMPASKRRHRSEQIRESTARSRLLQHQSLTNWVLVQRTLIHLAQMLEIIATGGRLRPTYGKGDTVDTSGNLVDQEA